MVWFPEGDSPPTRVTDQLPHSLACSLGNLTPVQAAPPLALSNYATWRDAARTHSIPPYSSLSLTNSGSGFSIIKNLSTMLNWITRYQKILELHPKLLDENTSVLEVGCGQIGISNYLDKQIVGLESSSLPSLAPNLRIVNGSILNPPFAEAEFDFVVCVDVLEHLARSDRRKALANMLHLAKRALILACPIADNASTYEDWLASWFLFNTGFVPNWLLEHVENGLPSLNDVISMIHETELAYSFFPNEGIYQHYAAVLLDHSSFPFISSDLRHHLSRSPHTSLISGSDWDKAYSYIFSIEKGQVRKPIIRMDFPGKASDQSARSVGLYSFHHPGVKPIQHAHFINILCGSDEVSRESSGMSDDVPKVVNRLFNKRWSELSGIYKLWVDQAQDQDLPQVVCLSHYRRILLPSTQSDHHLLTNSHAMFYQYASLLDVAELTRRCLDEAVVFAPIPVELGCPIYNHYALCHNERDLSTMIDILVEKRPEFLEYIPSLTSDTRMYAWNMIALRLEWFNDLCDLWFSVLLEFESRMPKLHYCSYQVRDISFLAERICHLWLVSSRDRLAANVVETPIIFHGSLGSSGFGGSRYVDVDL